MIWGMTLQPGYEYTEIVDDEIRLSMATLECRPRKAQGDTFELSSHVVLKTIRGEFLLCNLEKGPTPQQNLDLVLQPRERVTFSVEGTGVVHLMGYTSESPEEQLDQDDPIDNATQLPPAEHHPEPPHHQGMDEMVQQEPSEEENQDIMVKSEPESVVIPILEEALEEMDQAAKEEELAASRDTIDEGLTGTTPVPEMNKKDMSGTIPTDSYGYQQISEEEGWLPPEQSRMRGVPTDSVPSTETPPSFSGGPMRSMHGGMSSDVPSTSYTHVSQVPAGRSSRTPATRRPAAAGNIGRSLTRHTNPSVKSRSFMQPAKVQGNMRRSANQPTKVPANTNRSDSQPINTPTVIAELGDGIQLQEWGNQDPSSPSSANYVSDTNVTAVRQVRNEMTNRPSQRVDKMYRCRHCRKEFMNRSTFLVHERRHTGKTCFHCQYCMKPFASRSELRIHERYHTGEKPFECRYCQKRFETSGNWKKHERCHTGEKPYSCSFCGKGFADMSNWRKHERMHQMKQS